MTRADILVVLELGTLLCGCAIDTAPLHMKPVRWHQEAVTVCSEPEYEEATIAAAAVWDMGPELVYVGSCPADVIVASGGPVYHGINAQTSTTVQLPEYRVIFATIYVYDFDRSLWDLQAVLTHELGHALGLEHTYVAGATMFPWIADHDRSARDLSETDVQMMEELYADK